MARKNKQSRGSARKSASKPVLPFTKENYYIFFAALATIILGYVIMGMGEVYGPMSLTIAPILVLIGYLVLVPLAILYRKKENTPEQKEKADTL